MTCSVSEKEFGGTIRGDFQDSAAGIIQPPRTSNTPGKEMQELFGSNNNRINCSRFKLLLRSFIIVR